MSPDTPSPAPKVIALGPSLPPDIGPPFARLAARDLSADETRYILEHLIPRLSALIEAPIDGLVLYGSARQVDDPGDIDALITTDGSARGGLWGDAGGHELDVFVEPLTTVLAGPVERWPHLARGVALYDPSGRLAPFIEAVAAHRAGPAPAPSVIDTVQLPVWARRQLARIRRRAADPALATMHRAGLIAMLPQLYTLARGTHGTSPTDWMRHTRTHDPELAPHLAALADPAGVDAALEAIVEALFPSG